MSPVGFEPTVSAREQPQAYTFDRAASGTAKFKAYEVQLEIMIIGHIQKLRNITQKTFNMDNRSVAIRTKYPPIQVCTYMLLSPKIFLFNLVI
jgi:hypothetical protein